MSKNRKLVRAIQNFYQQFRRKPPSTVKEQSLWLLRSFIVTKKRPEWVNAGFVLPTVAMVSLVVVLLTVAILFRSFERSKNASNVRVNQVVLNAAMPAIDRAKAKIDKIFDDPTLPRSTPSDGALYNALTRNLSKYTFGDENPLEIRYDIDGNKNIKADAEELENREVTRTAWRFPVDTDNNGKFDSFTVYGIFFRTPSRDSDSQINRARTPLDSRTPPMSDGNLGGPCAAATGTSASLIGDSGWYSSDGVIKKSFFVYSASVPISDENAASKYGKDFEEYKGNKGFSAVEYQQDKERIPINGNAVVYEDDLEITPGGGLNLNGRIFTNSNLLTGKIYDPIKLYQVSSPKSCFYKPERSKIVVGGNIGYGRVNGTSARGGTEVHLYTEKPNSNVVKKYIDSKTRNVNNSAKDIAFNSQAYAQRINLLVQKQTGTNPINYSQDPAEVQENIKTKLADNPGLDVAEVRREELENYFKKRTRKVPFAEVDLGENPGTPILQDRGKDTLRAQDRWIYPFDPNRNSTSYTNLNLYLTRLEATEPNMLAEIFKEYEQYLGDRVVIGNNLPALWFDKNIKDFVGNKAPQDVLPKTAWTKWGDEESKYRYRSTKIQQEIDLNGASKRDGLFEVKASEKPDTPLDNVGGMRVITGAGIYVDGTTYQRGANHFLPEPQWDRNFVNPDNVARRRGKEADLWFNGQQPIIVWPDSMPMTGGNGQSGQGDLVMRATAVYHYAKSSGIEQVPIACVSSYYDPTNEITAQNQDRLPTVADSIGADPTTSLGQSNNGIVYRAPYTSNGARRSAMSRLSAQLERQARLVFPNGRFANEPLRDALDKRRRGQTLSMADNSAVDTAICAIEINNGRLARERSLIPDGAIYEAAFLDARQVKAMENTPNLNGVTPNYSMDIEQRQPLEVRVTVLDLEKLRTKKISGGLRQEYLIPNSGIIYATRNDALLDLSDSSDDIDTQKLLSPTDYLVDSTRRPNGIMLINGERIHRELNFREEEKGLILATNLPAYIKGDLNIHAKGGNVNSPVEEFTLRLVDSKGNINWDNFYKRTTTDPNFACRKNDPRLPKCTLGDSWRPATLVADAVTVLSENYRFGFRSEGDYDLRNNAGNRIVLNYDFNSNGNSTDTLNETALGVDLNGDGDTTDRSVSEANQISTSAVRRKLGFFDNNYLTSADWFDTNTVVDSPKDDFDANRSGDQSGSSYVNNFITPIQRRVKFAEYVMEMCPKLPVETCEADDWVVQGTTTKASEIAIGTNERDLESGTTARLATNPQDRRYPRRVAFLRDPSTDELILDDRGAPVPIGIDNSGKVQYYPYRELKLPFDTTGKKFDRASTTIETFNPFSSSNRPRIQDRALWFQTAGDSNFSNNPPTNENYGKAEPLFF
ncbi:MAG: hormogonium polysaccharide biosynthesis protein HpsA, partial [Rivularia sp. (in: cyanobacteria)]